MTGELQPLQLLIKRVVMLFAAHLTSKARLQRIAHVSQRM